MTTPSAHRPATHHVAARCPAAHRETPSRTSDSSAQALTRLSHTLQDRVAQATSPARRRWSPATARRGVPPGFRQARPGPGRAHAARRDLPHLLRMTKPHRLGPADAAVARKVSSAAGRSDPPVSRRSSAWPRVAVFTGGALETTGAHRAVTVQDLLRHTSGLTYEFRGSSLLHKAYLEARCTACRQTNQEQAACARRAAVACFSQARVGSTAARTDVLGRLVEVISGQALGQFLAERILQPLGMQDTGFAVSDPHQDRIAEPFPSDPDGGSKVALLDVRRPAIFESGGGGMVSTAMDYARFLQMLLNGRHVRAHAIARPQDDRADGRPTTWAADSRRRPSSLPPGHGFGPGFMRCGWRPEWRRSPDLVAGLLLGGVAGDHVLGGPRGTPVGGCLTIQAPGQARALSRPVPRHGLRRASGKPLSRESGRRSRREAARVRVIGSARSR